MVLPGFSADASLYGASAGGVKVYRVRKLTKNENDVLPQASKNAQRWHARCSGRCTGGYIGGAAGCFLNNTPNCMSDNQTQYENCQSDCDFLLSVME
jgi:hypothetical protein